MRALDRGAGEEGDCNALANRDGDGLEVVETDRRALSGAVVASSAAAPASRLGVNTDGVGERIITAELSTRDDDDDDDGSDEADSRGKRGSVRKAAARSKNATIAAADASSSGFKRRAARSKVAANWKSGGGTGPSTVSLPMLLLLLLLLLLQALAGSTLGAWLTLGTRRPPRPP